MSGNFPELNKDKAGIKGGSGQAWGGKQIIPTEGFSDGFEVDGTKNRNQAAVNGDCHYPDHSNLSMPVDSSVKREAPRKGDATPGGGW